MTAVATAERLRAALAAVGGAWSPSDVAAHYLPTSTNTSAASAGRGSPPPPPDDLSELADPMHLTAADVESPYAWKPRRRLTDEESKLLNQSVAEGNRSDMATKATREVLIDALNVRSWRTAKWYYDRFPVFAKFRERDEQARAKGQRHSAENPSLSFTHWSSVIVSFRNHRPPVAAEDKSVIDRALAEVACWDDADLVAAAVAVIHYRYSDGHGIDDRPISTRCLAAWLNCEHTTAGRRIKGLIERGLLELVIPHNRYTGRQEAHRYRLLPPSPLYRTNLHHELTSPPLLTHPVWGDLSQNSRHAWQQLSTAALTTSQVAALIGHPRGTASHGTKKLLDDLAAVGLATQHGRGRGTTWTRGTATLDDAAEQLGTVARHRLLLATINAAREAWHTTNPRTRTAARTRLAYLHKRQHALGPKGLRESEAGQMSLFESLRTTDVEPHAYASVAPARSSGRNGGLRPDHEDRAGPAKGG